MYCPKCGKPVGKDHQFCASCGNGLASLNQSLRLEAVPVASPSYAFTAPNNAEAAVKPKPVVRDMMEGDLAMNIIAMIVLRLVTAPWAAGQEEAVTQAIAGAFAIGLFALVTTGVFYLFRRDHERQRLKRSFAIAMWVFAVLLLVGSRS